MKKKSKMKTKEVKKLLKKANSNPNFKEVYVECKNLSFKILGLFDGKNLQAGIMSLGHIILVLEERHPDIPVMELVYEAHYQTKNLMNPVPENEGEDNYIAR